MEQIESYNANRDIATLQDAVRCLRSAASLSLKGIGEGALTFGMLGVALLHLFNHAGGRENLDAAIVSNRLSLANNLGDPLFRSEGLTNLASTLLARFQLDGDRPDLEEAINKCHKALELTPPSYPTRCQMFSNLAYALRVRFERSGDPLDLDEAIVNSQNALDLTQRDHPNRSTMHHTVARVRLTRFEHAGNLSDLDEGIIHNSCALDLRPPGHPDRSASLGNLAGALLLRFDRGGDRADLDDSIAKSRNALELQPHGHPDRSASLGNLASALLTRFKKGGDRTDLHNAIINYRSVLELSPPGHPAHFVSLGGLAHALETRFKQDGNLRDREEATINLSKALEITPEGHSNRFTALTSLADALHTRFEASGDPADLDSAVINHYKALELCSQGHPSRPSALSSTAEAILTRFGLTGNRAELEEAIAMHRTALELAPIGHTKHSTYLDNLANALNVRFEQIGDPTDLDEIVDKVQRALQLKPPGHPDRLTSLILKGSALLNRFQRNGNYTDLEDSMAAHHSALKLTPKDDPTGLLCLNNLAGAYIDRFKHFRDPADLNEAIVMYRNILELRPPGHPRRSISFSNLASSLLTRYRELGDFLDLEQAIINNRNALELRPPGHPDRSTSLGHLANALAAQFETISSKNKKDKLTSSNMQHAQAEIVELFEEAASPAIGGPISVRLKFALAWAEVAVRWSHLSTIRAHQVSLEALDTLVASGSSLESRHMRLTSEESHQTRTLAVSGASCALASGNVELAVEMLEQGRSVLLTQAGRYRTRVDDLKSISPRLAEGFRSASEKMESSIMALARRPNEEDAVANYQNLFRKWIDIVDQIRSLGGFESFLQPTPFSVLRETAANGPVIVVNHSPRRTDAIIIRSNGDPLLVELPDARPAHIHRLVESAHHRTGDKAFKNLLRSIWKVIVQPIARVLQSELQLPPGSRIWWCPTGAISHLPLHAAGDYAMSDQNLPDLFISSYIPTLSALLRVRQSDSNEPRTASRILVIGQPETPGQTPLPSVPLEVKRIEALADHVTVVKGADGNREAVLNAMSQHPCIHLSCHGRVDQEKPFQSSFALHDGPLTLLDIARQDLPQADLAFLSACHSAAGNRERPDEALHLAAGLQFAGFRTVVGTLWAMCDQDGPNIAESFYASLLGTRGRGPAKSSAHALHRAVGELRRRGVSYSRWTCFVHFGC